MAIKPKVRFLVPVWGKRYIKRFVDLALPSFLAPGNLPALAEVTDLEIVILTSSANYPDFNEHPVFRSLRRIAPLRFISIDDLITDQVYGVTLTLAYLRGVTDTGSDMVAMHFLLMNSDIVLADGSLSSVAKHILEGRRIILANSIRAISDELEEPLRRLVDKEKHVLALPPRRLVSMAMKSLHPTQIAKIVNNDLCHSIHVNQFYWQVNSTTLVSRHFLMFMLCLKPERVVTEVHAFCDYSFVPEFCPSGGAVAMEDSDDFFALEMQARNSESDYLRIGRPSLEEIANSLSQWTTKVHRDDSLNHTLIFHSDDVPIGTEAVCREADRYIRAIHKRLVTEPKPYRHHPYWTGALIAWERRKALLHGSGPSAVSADCTAIPPPWFAHRLARVAYRAIMGVSPRLRIWHPDWLDYRIVSAIVSAHVNRQKKKILYVKRDIGHFDQCVGPVEVINLKQVVAGELDKTGIGPSMWTLALVEPQRDELNHIRSVIEKLKPLMDKGGQIVVFYKDNPNMTHPADLADELMRSISYIAPLELNKTRFSFSGGERKRRVRMMFDRSVAFYNRYGPLALPFAILLVFGLLVLSALNNLRQVAAQDRRAPVGNCSSFTLVLDVE